MTEKKAEITAVLFDWDHTLAHTQINSDDFSVRLAAMFELAGLDYSQTEIQSALQALAANKTTSHTTPQTRQEIGWAYYHLLKELGHPDLSWPLLIRLYRTYAFLPTMLYPDALPVLAQLQARGYTLGILSNHSASARPMMEKLVGDFVPAHHITISEEEGVHKPARTIFQRAAGRVKTPPQACILVGDNLQVDAVGAVRRGGYGRGIWLDRSNYGAPNLPEGIVRMTSLQALVTWLDA